MLRIFVLSSLLCFSINGSTQNNIKNLSVQKYIKDFSTLVNKTHAERTILLTPFYEEGIRFLDSIQLFSTFKKIDDLASKSNDAELALETKLMRLHYFCYRDYFQKEFVVEKIEGVNEIAKSKKILWLEIQTQSLLANYLFDTCQNYGLGFEYYERISQLLENIADKDYPLKQICLYQLARAYLIFHEYENAIPHLIKAKNIKSPLLSYFYRMRIYNALGFSYRKTQQMDSSFFYFKKNLKTAEEFNDRVWLGISSGNIGENYFMKGQYKKAQPLLELDAKIGIENKDWGLPSNAFVYLSYIELEKANLSKAATLADKALYYAHKSQQYHRFVITYPLHSKIASYQSKPELASKYIDSTTIAKDSLAKLFNVKKLIRAKQRIQLEKQKLKEEKIKQANQERIWARNITIISLAMFLLITALFYNRQQLRAKNKTQELLLEKQLTLQKLESASKRLEDFKQSLLNKNTIIEQLEKNLSISNKVQNNEVIQEQLEKLTILTAKDWRTFVELFEQVHTGFFNRLKEKYPYLTPSETRFMALYRLELENQEMALILGVGTNAIRQIKSRLRKKINLQKETTIQELVLNI